MDQQKRNFKPDIIMIVLLTLLSTAERIQILGIPVYAILFIPYLYKGLVNTLRNSDGRLLCDRFELTIIIWILVGCMLSLINGLGGDYRGIEGLMINAIIIFCIYTYKDEGFDISFLIGVLCGLVLNLVIGVMEININGFHVISNLTESYIRIFRSKAIGFQVNANDYCAMLVIYIIGLLYLLEKLNIRNRFVRLHIYICLSTSAYVIINDFSRSAVICLIICALYLLVYKLFGKRRWQMISIFLLIVGGITLFMTNGIESNFSAFMDVNSDTIRLQTYQNIWEFIKEHYFLGVGPGNTTRLTGSSSHNLIFELLSDYGIFVTVLLLTYILRLLSYRSEMDKGDGYYLIMLFGICFLLSGFSVSSLLRNRICWVFFAYFIRQIREIKLYNLDSGIPTSEYSQKSMY